MLLNRPLSLLIAGAIFAWLPAKAQSTSSDSVERWNVHLQATSIGQHHGSFPSLYEGEHSLPSYPENRVSLTATVFLTYRVNSWTELVVNPEVSGGRGFGHVNGIAGFTNGEIPRVAGATPKLYPARAYLKNTWALSPQTEMVEGGPNQLAGRLAVCRFTLITGKFAITDFFDNNSYSHDPRRQFMNWSLMSNGAWDYPADTRGYTIGSVQELTMRGWSLRAATVMEPTEANGPTFDTRLAKNRGVAVEWEQRYKPMGHAGTLRVLGFQNLERSGTFRDAILPDGTTDLASTRRSGTKKYGFGLNVEQEITRDIGAFARYGWSDGKTEAWAFTQIDRSVSGGISVPGRLWTRPGDHIGVAAVRNYLAGDDRSFLAAGGIGFIVGDGRLNYAPESITEAYYAWHAIRDWTFTLDYQRVVNPAYNRDRGPVSAWSLRVHWER
jgi:high affinity Mn2+ porin